MFVPQEVPCGGGKDPFVTYPTQATQQPVVLEVNSIALLKSQQTFQQSFYSSVVHPVVLETLLKSL